MKRILLLLLFVLPILVSGQRLKIGKQLEKAPGINYMVLTDINGEQYYTPMSTVLGSINTDQSLGTVTLSGNNLIITERNVLTGSITATYTINLAPYMQTLTAVDNGNGTVTLNMTGDPSPELIDICNIVSTHCNTDLTVSPTGLVTFTDNAGNNFSFNLTSPAAGNDLTYNNGLYFDETVTGLSYNPTTHALSYVNEAGATNTITLDVAGLTFNAGTNTLTYTAENGVVTNIVLPADVVTTITNTIAGNRIATYTNENGVAVDIDETITTIVNNGDGTYTYTNEAGATATFPAQTNTDTRLSLSVVNDSLRVDVVNIVTGATVSTSYIDNVINHPDVLTTLAYNSTTHTLTYTDENGGTTNLPLDVATMTYNATTNTITYTAENGTVTNIALPVETVTTITNTVTGHKIADYTNELGVVVSINETVIGTVNNPDGSITITKEDGSTFTSVPVAVNGSGSITAVEVSPNVFNLAFKYDCDSVLACIPADIDTIVTDFDIVGNTASITLSSGQVFSATITHPADSTVLTTANTNIVVTETSPNTWELEFVYNCDSITNCLAPIQMIQTPVIVAGDTIGYETEITGPLGDVAIDTIFFPAAAANVIVTQQYNPITVTMLNGGIDTIGYENITFTNGVETDRDTTVYDFNETRYCLNNFSFTPANPLMPTWAEVQAWALANLSALERINGTHVVYFIPNQGGDCDNPDYTWVFNKGSELVTRTENTILILPNYTALRNLTKYNHDVVIVDDWTYTGPDGNTYTTLGGVFKRIHPYMGRTLTENGGTIIVGVDGSKWERDWDKIHVQPEWWECGGYDSFGNIYVSKLTSVNGIYNESDRIIHAAHTGSNLQLFPNKLYDNLDVDMKITCETVSGNNATFKRFATPFETTTVASTIGSTTVTVTDGSKYRVGQIIFFVNVFAPNGGLAFGENVGLGSVHAISNINGNTITFANGLTGNVGVGWKCIVYNSLLNYYNSNNGLCTIKQLNFDGNRDNNQHCFDWRMPDEISANNTDDLLLIQNCFFRNSIIETINYGKLHIKDCGYYDLGGSFVHVSANTDRPAIVIIEGCHGEKSNQISNSLSSHSEATITSSANTSHIRITNCNFIDGGEAVFTSDSFDDFDFSVENNNFKNYKYAFIGGTGGGIKVEKNLRINNNTFDNCGPIYISSSSPSSIYKNTASTHVYINDNTFINTTMKMEHVGYINIANNKFYWDNSKTTKYDYATNPLSPQQGFNHFLYFDRLHIINNVFEYPNVHNVNTQYGLLLQHNGVVRKTSGGVDTEYLFAQDVKVNGNTFAGFKYAITTINSTAPQNANLVKQAVGWEYKNNIIYMSRNTGANNGTGIFVDPGVVCESNTIYTNSTIPCYAGIIAAGVGTTGNAHNRLLGAICINNKIMGCGGSTAADIVANAGGTQYNVTCINNMTRDDVFNATNGYFTGNYKLITANYPQLTSMTCPEWRYFGEDSNQY